MRTMHPVLKRGGLYWDRELLPPDAYRGRFTRLQAEIAAAGDDAWLIYGDVERYGAVAWFSNFLPRTRSALALVPRVGDPTLLISVGQRDVPAAKTLTWVDDVRPFTRLPRTLVALIEEKGLQNAQLGFACVEELMPIKDWDEIFAALPGMRVQSRTGELSRMRVSKDACEIEAIRASARIVASSLDLCATAIAPGKSVREVSAEIERHLRAHAAEDVRIMVASGEQTGVSMRPADSRVLQAGDAVMIYVAAEAQRYWAEAARTFVIGPASDAMRDLAATADAALTVLRDAIREGVSMKTLVRTLNAEIADESLRASIGDYGVGNGIGLDIDEAPVIVFDNLDTIANNATMALRVIGHINGLGVSLGETVLFRDGKVERLTGAPGLVLCR